MNKLLLSLLLFNSFFVNAQVLMKGDTILYVRAPNDTFIISPARAKSIAITGDVSGSGTASITATLSNTTVSAGSYSNANITVDAAGRLTGASSGTAGTADTYVLLASDITNNNVTANTIADVTGLSFSVISGNTYKFRFVIAYTSAATTTGSRWSINGPAVTFLYYYSTYCLTATSQTTNHGLSAYNVPAASNASSAATGSNIALVEGIIRPSANGTVIARFASEISASAIVAKAGSYIEYKQLN